MQQLLGEKLGTSTDANSFLRELFLQRLPPNVRMVLASADPSTTLENLADMADKIMEVSTPSVAAMSTASVDNSEVKQLRDEVSRLADLLASLSRAHHSRRRTPSRTCPPANTPPPSQPPQDALCWYHAKFGANAQKCREPCSWEQGGRLLMATGVTGQAQSRLFYVCDNNTHTHFLIDTGSEVSVLPPSPSDRRHLPDKLTLTAVNDTPIPTFGKRSLTLDLGLRRSFP